MAHHTVPDFDGTPTSPEAGASADTLNTVYIILRGDFMRDFRVKPRGYIYSDSFFPTRALAMRVAERIISDIDVAGAGQWMQLDENSWRNHREYVRVVALKVRHV